MQKLFRKRIPFLNLIEDDIYFSLDFSEFVLPDERVNELREKLEKDLDAYVMTYKLNGISLNGNFDRYLCGNIKTATLDIKDLRILNDYENAVKDFGISFCVYEKPISYFSAISI